MNIALSIKSPAVISIVTAATIISSLADDVTKKPSATATGSKSYGAKMRRW